jgi:dolichol-phosphate mannosyltransferase
MTADPRVTIIIPAYEEGDAIVPCLDRIFAAVSWCCEVAVVVDSIEDATVPVLADYAKSQPQLRTLVNTYGRGPANAIRYGFDHATAPVVVVTMADGSDDPEQIEPLCRLVERGVVVAAASRYAPGGQQVGGPFVKGLMSKTAGRSLYTFARIGTRDATNSFKAYDRKFVQQVGIDSRSGFEIGLELTVKAKRLGLPIAELPTIWLERHTGVSNFKVWTWVPKYLFWYRHAFGRRLTVEELQRGIARSAEDD